MERKEKLSASLEDYLEAIYHVQGRKQAVRAKDLVDRLQVRGSSVTGALQALSRRELINYAPYDLITLTERGRRVAREVVSRHQVLRRFFIEVLDVEAETAEKAACRMEHSLPAGILERLTGFIEYVAQEPEGLIEGFRSHRQQVAQTRED